MSTPESQLSPDNPMQENGDVNSQLRQIIMSLGPLAQQAPEIQQEIQLAARALTQAQMKLMSSTPAQGMGQQQQPVVAS